MAYGAMGTVASRALAARPAGAHLPNVVRKGGSFMSIALIVGVEDGLSASIARKLSARGHRLVLVARNAAKLEKLAAESNAVTVACDAAEREAVAALFDRVDEIGEELEVVVYNPSARSRGAFVDLDPDSVQASLQVTAFGAFLVAQQAARRMVPRGRGEIGRASCRARV